jgi:hypothetical protein
VGVGERRREGWAGGGSGADSTAVGARPRRRAVAQPNSRAARWPQPRGAGARAGSLQRRQTGCWQRPRAAVAAATWPGAGAHTALRRSAPPPRAVSCAARRRAPPRPAPLPPAPAPTRRARARRASPARRSPPKAKPNAHGMDLASSGRRCMERRARAATLSAARRAPSAVVPCIPGAAASPGARAGPGVPRGRGGAACVQGGLPAAPRALSCGRRKECESSPRTVRTKLVGIGGAGGVL